MLLRAAVAGLIGFGSLCSAAEPAPATSPIATPASGPMGLRIQGVVRELFLDPILVDARPLERPVIDLRVAFANSWNVPMQVGRGGASADQFFDEQADSLTAKLATPWSHWVGAGPPVWGSNRGIFERLSTSLEWRLTLHSGGWTDGLIEGVHTLFGAFNFRRADFARNSVHLHFTDSRGNTAFSIDHPTVALGDLVTRTQWTLFDRSHAASAIRFDLKLPTGALSQAGSSGGFDAAIALGTSVRISPIFTVHVQLAVACFSGFDVPIALQPNRWHFFGDLSLQLKLGPLELLLEDRVATQVLESGWETAESFSAKNHLSSGFAAEFRPHNQVSLGVRWRSLTLWAAEDFTPGANPQSVIKGGYESSSPDLVLGLAWTQPL